MGEWMRRAALASLAGLAACGTKDPEPATSARSPDGSAVEGVNDSGAAGTEDASASDDVGVSPSPAPTGTSTVPGDASPGDAGAPSPGWKRGLAYGYDSDADMTALSKGIGWWYNWAASPDGTLTKGFTAGVEYVPMIWGGNFDTTTPP